MYCVVVAFKMIEWVEELICIKFCIRFEHSSVKTLQMIQKDAAVGNWWLAASSWQAHSWIMSHAEFFGKIPNHPGDAASLQPRFGTLLPLAFPKTKIAFESKDISDCQWKSGKYNGANDGNWENCVRSQDANFEGVRCHCPIYNVSIFYITGLETFWTDLICLLLICELN